ncbi:MAG: hypothetical protein WCY30_04905 [Candidatus Neomarinimicrobiota bacterium]
MSYQNFDYEALWFDIFRKVLQQNEALGEGRLDKIQLREITTAIFIARTQRGYVKPVVNNQFTDSVIKLLSDVKDRDHQMEIYKTIKTLVKPNQS